MKKWLPSCFVVLLDGWIYLIASSLPELTDTWEN